ncbi:MAG: hypothetical protein V4537_00520 [Pseudomonadota bacterium]
MRPQSIVRFEWLYLASFVIGLLSTAQNWGVRNAMLAGNKDTAHLTWIGPATTIVGIVIALALWWLVARMGNVVAKWVVVVFAAWAVVLLAVLGYGLVTGRGEVLPLAIGALQNILYVVAAAQLFGADTPAWFGEGARVEPVA